MFEDLDDPEATGLTPPLDAVTQRVVRKRRQRRLAISGAAALLLVVGGVTTTRVRRQRQGLRQHGRGERTGRRDVDDRAHVVVDGAHARRPCRPRS